MVEGIREIRQALAAGIVPREVYICRDFIVGDEAGEMVQKLEQLSSVGATVLFEVTPPVFAKMAYRGESGGILLVIAYQEYIANDLLQADSAFLIVLDSAEKPGNIGAVLRTADAAGVTGMILSAGDVGGTDIHNPNVIRASLGAIFSVPTVTMPAHEAMIWLKSSGIKLVATTPQASGLYTDVSLPGSHF